MATYATYTALADIEVLEQLARYAELPVVKNRNGQRIAPLDVVRLLRLCAESEPDAKALLRSIVRDLDPRTTNALVTTLVDEWMHRGRLGDHWVFVVAREFPQTTASKRLAPMLAQWRRQLDATAARLAVGVVATSADPLVLRQLLPLALDSRLGTVVVHALVNAKPTALAEAIAPSWLGGEAAIDDAIAMLGYPLMAAPWRFSSNWFRTQTSAAGAFAHFAQGLLWWVRGRAVQLDDDGSLIDEGDVVVAPRAHQRIELLQPWRLSAPTMRMWQSRLADYEIVQPFDQLNLEMVDA